MRGSDVVHAHLWGSGMWGALLARCARRPFIAHAHRFDADRSRTWLPGYRYWIAPAAHRIICVSDEISAAFLTGGLPPEKLVVVPNGVVLGGALPRAAAREELGLPSGAMVVGLVARLREEKRHDLALQCLALLRQRGHDVVLCIVGDGPEEERLRRLGDELGLGAAVRWAGSRENAGRLMCAFDAALITSTVEGMPLAALEALVEGVPIVSAPAGAMPDLLAQGGGMLVAGWDAGEIADALASVLHQPDVEALVRSTEWARGRFGIDQVARDIEHLYEGAVNGSS
jgi:glycosyltransferase involved in cell wall biosynthesis